MIGCSVKGYKRACTSPVGGADLLLIGDANDWDFTLDDPDTNGDDTGYSAVARRGGSGATATATAASGAVTGVTVGSGGSGWVTPPTVVFTGAGTGAAATAVITNGVITAINVTSGGTGYTSAPTVSFTGGGATAQGGAYFYEIDSIIDTIGVDISQANADGTASAWDYTISARLAIMSQAMTNFNRKIDAAAVCCDLVVVWRHNDGTIFVAGEKYVNGTKIPRFAVRQDGSKVSSGKKFTDFNGQDLSLKSSYSRLPYEFTGGIGVIDGFTAP